MVFSNPDFPAEQQIQRHAISHLPDGQDPLPWFGNPGDILVFVNGVLTPTTPTSGSPAIPGTVKAVYIPFGSEVANGQTYAP